MKNLFAFASIFLTYTSPCFAMDYQELLREVSYPGKASDSTLGEISRLPDGSPEVNCLFQSAVKGGDCKHIDTVKLLLEKGAVPVEAESKSEKRPGLITKGFSCERSKELSRVLEKECIDMAMLMVGKMDPLEVSRLFGKDSGVSPSSKYRGAYETEKEKRHRDLLNQVIATMKKRCERDGVDSAACVEAKNLEAREQSFSDAQKQRADEEAAIKKKEEDSERDTQKAASSPAAIQQRACQANANIRLADTQLTLQREVGRESGYVDKGALHQLAQMKVFAKLDLEKLKAEYKKRTGAQLDLGKCK